LVGYWRYGRPGWATDKADDCDAGSVRPVGGVPAGASVASGLAVEVLTGGVVTAAGAGVGTVSLVEEAPSPESVPGAIGEDAAVDVLAGVSV
jgi:hypothetical protein